MIKRCVICVLAGIILLSLASSAHAWDGQRQGFLLGFGIGPGFTSYTQTVAASDPSWGGTVSFESDRENKAGVMTDFKIGYAPENSWAIYYTSKVSWFVMKNALGDNVTIANGLGAVAACYWFQPQYPSPFVAGGVGFSTWSVPFEDPAPDSWIGPGFFAGGGYEFSRNISVEGYLSLGSPRDTESGIEVKSDTFSFMVTLNWLGY
ncbi:MAG: hypothetical protein JSV10_04025 [Candidatus Zixiibacteriota bacterium]|nr:MAG: hypothetical protein JSV10_04025 [candidate division Zixibacteria bacterium]